MKINYALLMAIPYGICWLLFYVAVFMLLTGGLEALFNLG
jgi:hypothetical protein